MPDNQRRGMKWIRTAKRLAIYLRDGMACVWCGQRGSDLGYGLTLDHVLPGNDHTHLVTACTECNASRGNRALTPEQWVHVDLIRHRPLDLAAGKALERLRASIPKRRRPTYKFPSRQCLAASLQSSE